MSHDILIIDDVTEIRETLRDVFELSGYEVRTAEHGESGMQQIERAAPCLILLDLMMPVMDGWQVLETLKDERAGALAAIPVVVLSGIGDPVEMDRLKQRFHCEVVPKPADIERLLGLAQTLCAAA